MAHLEYAMATCLSDMEKLQTNMLKLQRTKQEQELTEEYKKSAIEPNMAVMKTWLKTVKKRANFDKLVKTYPDDYIKKCGCAQVDRQNEAWRTPAVRAAVQAAQHERQRQALRTVGGRDAHVPPPSGFGAVAGEEVRQCKHKQGDDKVKISPSEFMKNYIEATYNLFQLLHKKIEVLELRLNNNIVHI